ncbi:MAG: hypothetical protein R2852_08010 [Bacteroidia bacterium]
MRNKKTLSIFKLTLLLPFAIILFFVFKQIIPKADSNSMLKESFWAHKVCQNSVYDIVFVGDSRVYRGIDPYVIDSMLDGVKSFNYGFSSAGLDSVLIYKAVNILDKNGKRVLVFGVSPNSFIKTSLQNNHLNMLVSQTDEELYIKQIFYPKLSVFNTYTLSDINKLLKGNHYYEEFNNQTGFVSSDRQPIDTLSSLIAYKHQFENNRISKKAIDDFCRTIYALQKAQIDVYCVRIPVSFQMKLLEDQMTDSFFYSFSERLKLQGVKILNANDALYNTYDGSHLNSKSATKYSQLIATMIAK